MSPEPITAGAIVGGVIKATLPQLAKEIVAKVKSKLNPTDLEKALEAGIAAAEKWDQSQAPTKWLFYSVFRVSEVHRSPTSWRSRGSLP